MRASVSRAGSRAVVVFLAPITERDAFLAGCGACAWGGVLGAFKLIWKISS